MKIGDLVVKRWGRIDPHQQGTLGVVTSFEAMTQYGNRVNPMLSGEWVLVWYPGQAKSFKYRPIEFEVISESR